MRGSKLLALGVAAFGLLAGVGLTAAIVVLLWHYSPVAVLLIVLCLLVAAGGIGCFQLGRAALT